MIPTVPGVRCVTVGDTFDASEPLAMWRAPASIQTHFFEQIIE